MPDLAATLPAALAKQTRFVRLPGLRADIPALLAHPDWTRPAPVVIWMHGRTVNKELDSGRYLRWVRAGIAACAIDLPGHGERFEASLHTPARTLDLIELAAAEVDAVLAALNDPALGGVFDLSRVAIGGMSAGGMAALRRLCEPHACVCAAVEGTAGNLAMLYGPSSLPRAVPTHPHAPERIAEVDPMVRVGRGEWRHLPLLALHSEADQVVPVACIRTFVERLREHAVHTGANPLEIELFTWASTGAALEHNGFGLAANEAKNRQLEFLSRWLLRQR